MKTGGRLTEEEMEELIASRDWDAYTGTMTHCREGKHDKCPERIQPTNHIDPHPTVCSCACHEDWDEDEFDWDEDDEFEFGEDDDDEYVFD